jgi:RNA polymerase sigma-70 factor (ECF subfamily)
MDDSMIIELFWKRSEQAIAETDTKYGSMCMTLAKNIVINHQDAEECVSDTYMSLWDTIPPTRPSILSAFIARIVRNLAMKKATYNNAQKRASNMAVSIHELEEYVSVASDSDGPLDEKELADCIEAFLHTTDYESRNIFLRRYWFFDSITEIADRFSISESKVKSRLFRTRNKLYSHLIKEGFLNGR